MQFVSVSSFVVILPFGFLGGRLGFSTTIWFCEFWISFISCSLGISNIWGGKGKKRIDNHALPPKKTSKKYSLYKPCGGQPLANFQPCAGCASPDCWPMHSQSMADRLPTLGKCMDNSQTTVTWYVSAGHKVQNYWWIIGTQDQPKWAHCSERLLLDGYNLDQPR